MNWSLILFISVFPGLVMANEVTGTKSLVAPIRFEGTVLGEAWTHQAIPLGYSIESAELIEALRDTLTPEALHILKANLGSSHSAYPEELAGTGISISFEESELVWNLKMAPEIRYRRNFTIRTQTRPVEGEILGPAPFSGYINYSLSDGVQSPRSSPRTPLLGSLNYSSNLYGYVLETGRSYNETQPYPWRREDTRITKDFESSSLRAVIGDQSFSNLGFQNSRNVGGISLIRQFSLQPYLSTHPINRQELNLERPSSIEVYVNDSYYSRLEVPAGPIQVSDFPLNSGLNRVDLKIIDNLGRISWMNLNLLYDVKLLGQGIHQFAVQYGLPSENFKEDREYDRQNQNFSGFHRFGLSDQVTLGVNFQRDRSISMGGIEAGVLTDLGTFNLDFGSSRLTKSKYETATRLQFHSLDYKLGQDKPIRGSMEIEVKTEKFGGIGQSNPLNPFTRKYDLFLSKPVSAVTNVGAGMQYLTGRAGNTDSKSFRSSLTSQLSSEWRNSLNYSYTRSNLQEHQVSVSLIWIENSGKYYGNFTYSYPEKSVRADLSRNPSAIVGDFRANLGLEKTPEEERSDLSLDYTAEKANIRLEHSTERTRDKQENPILNHQSSIAFSSAISWVGTDLAFSRTIFDSFALIKSTKNLKKYEISVNPTDTSSEAKVNSFGPGVHPTLSSYLVSPLQIDNSELPQGVSVGKEYYYLRPTYKSAIRIEVGANSSATFVGKLYFQNKKPADLKVGDVFLLFEGKETRVSGFFTNRQGQFILENLAPGSYRLHLSEVDHRPVFIEVKEDQVGIVHLDSIMIQEN